MCPLLRVACAACLATAETVCFLVERAARRCASAAPARLLRGALSAVKRAGTAGCLVCSAAPRLAFKHTGLLDAAPLAGPGLAGALAPDVGVGAPVPTAAGGVPAGNSALDATAWRM